MTMASKFFLIFKGISPLYRLVIAVFFMTISPLLAEAKNPLIASLDSHIVAISIDFTGNEVLLFGSIDEEGDVIVVVSGPRGPATVRKKAKTLGIWHNADAVTFDNVPGFYFINYTGKILPFVSEGSRLRHEIGVENLNMHVKNSDGKTLDEIQEYRQALISEKKKINTFNVALDPIERLGDHLFRTSFFVPATAPVGTYTVEVFLVRDGKIISAQATPLFVRKTGIEAQIYNIAYKHSAFYGIVAILIAIFAGYAANWIFRKK